MSAEIPYSRRVTSQIWVVTRHQYGLSTIVQTSFRVETSGGVVECWLFSQAIKPPEIRSNASSH